jgi:hypothetical protein
LQGAHIRDDIFLVGVKGRAFSAFQESEKPKQIPAVRLDGIIGQPLFNPQMVDELICQKISRLIVSLWFHWVMRL